MKTIFSVLLFFQLAFSSLLKENGLYMISPDNNFEVIEQVFLEQSVILIGVSLSNIIVRTYYHIDDCDECELMERELRKAASLVKVTKEKINFGLIKLANSGDLKMGLNITKFPALVAIK